MVIPIPSPKFVMVFGPFQKSKHDMVSTKQALKPHSFKDSNVMYLRIFRKLQDIVHTDQLLNLCLAENGKPREFVGTIISKVLGIEGEVPCGRKRKI